jgi:hypothetical protein
VANDITSDRETTLLDDLLLDTLGPFPGYGPNHVFGRPFQRLKGRFRQIVGQDLPLRRDVQPKAELHALLVPTIQVPCLREVRVTANPDRTEPSGTAHLDALIDPGGGTFMRGTAPGAIDQSQDFAGIGQRQQ